MNQNFIVSPAFYREIIELVRPNCFKLYFAAWRSGSTVNGCPPK